MSYKSEYLTLNQLKRIQNNIIYLGSENLKEEIEYSVNKQCGEYLINILSDECLIEFLNLRKNYNIY